LVLNISMENTNQISIADLDTIKNIIDLACTRGAFKGEEVYEVGVVYNKLKNFLDVIIARAKEQQQSADVPNTGSATEPGQTQGE